MTTPATKPPFAPLALDEFDSRLDARAAERGIPTLTRTEPTPAPAATPPEQRRAGQGAETARAAPRSARRSAARPGPSAPADDTPTPRARMKSLNVELPDYVWVHLKTRAASEMVSVRHVIMTLLQNAGIEIAAVDMLEDGRRQR